MDMEERDEENIAASILESTYYHQVWKNRLSWTKHVIPVRAKDALTGFFVECYLDKPSAPSSIDQKCELSLAFMPTTINNIIYASIFDIYPTRRKITVVNKENNTTKQVTKSDQHNPKEILGIDKLPDLFKSYKGCSFSHAELQSMLNTEFDINEVNLELAPDGLCIINSEITKKYKGMKMEVNTNIIVHESLKDLYSAYKNCTSCNLGDARLARNELDVTPGRHGLDLNHNPVTNSTVMFIGEAPGMQEEKTKIAFHPEAPAGGVLDKVLNAANLALNERYYTNAVLCRPEPTTKNLQNGKPNVECIEICNTRLKNEIALVKPKIVCLLGKVAYRAFYGVDPESILKLVGWQNTEKTIYLLQHPSYVVRELSFANAEKAPTIKTAYLAHFKEIVSRFNELKN